MIYLFSVHGSTIRSSRALGHQNIDKEETIKESEENEVNAKVEVRFYSFQSIGLAVNG